MVEALTSIPGGTMTRYALAPVVGAALCLGLACSSSPESVAAVSGDRPLFQATPAQGNSGGKIVTPIDFVIPSFTTCPNGQTIDLHIVGWIQDRPGSEPPNQPGIVSFYFDFIYSNAAGETYVWHQVGVQRFYFNDRGELILATAGRTLDQVGRVLINLTTGHVESVSG